MTVLITLSLLILFFIGCVARMLFWELPASATAVARNRLFELRSELFELAGESGIAYSNRGYRYCREMLNATIRYAHDVTALQLLISALSRKKSDERRAFQEFRNDFNRELDAMPQKIREHVKRIIDEADMAVVQLVVTRSVFLSALFSAFLFVFVLHQLTYKARHSVKTWLESRRESQSEVQQAIEEMLRKKPLRRTVPIIRFEAAHYMKGRNGALCAA